jgi:hypothetical protein
MVAAVDCQSMRIILVFLVLLSTDLFCSTETSETSLVDSSQVGSPLVLSGAVTAKDEIEAGIIKFSFRTDISMTNVSHKGILLLVIKVDMTGANGLGIHHTKTNDYFFTSDVFKPGATETTEESIGPIGERQGATEEQPPGPTATAEVAFVQFVDGSTWGNASEGREIIQERRETCDRLKFLVAIHQSKDENRFIDSFMESSSLPGINHLQWMYKNTKDKSDNDFVFRTIQQMLGNAEVHLKAMNRLL